ncbi:putative coiled-coil protein SlyX [Nitrobacteraceae bacterium AZCC 2161]
MADQIDVGTPPVHLSRGRSSRGFAVVAVLVVIAGAAGFAWLTFGDRILEVPSLASTPGSAAAPVAASDTGLVASSDFQAFQQQTSETLQSATQLLSAQQAELRRLSDEVSRLTAKIDLLQSTVAVASVKPPSPPPLASAKPPSPPPVPAAATAPRKKPVVPKPAGAISVGGAPLPAAGQLGR